MIRNILVASLFIAFCANAKAYGTVEEQLEDIKWQQHRHNYLIREQQWQQQEAERMREYQQRIDAQNQDHQRQLDYQMHMYSLDR